MAAADHIAALIADGIQIDEIISAYGKHHAAGLQAYVKACPISDDLELAGSSEFGMVSEGADPGAWVLAWVWVTDDQAGVESADDEDDEGEE